MPRRKLLDNQPTTTQRLNSIIKSCRDTMRKDRGLSSDIDRLPMLTAFMFLKFIDDKEKILEAESTPLSPYRPWIDPPYRWRDWASDTEDSTEQNLHLLTGDDLISFVYDAKFIFPSGQEEAGLIQYLRNLRSDNGRKQRDVIAAIYSDFHYRMVSGHLFREMINKLEGLNFTSTDEIHTLSHIYETMLKQMRDAAGDSGEFYTPRPIVKFMVKAMNPKLGETVLDPACGTGGFLVESFRHLYSQVRTTKDMDILQESVMGGEAKPLPYMLCQMNMMLHDVENPHVEYGNSLRFKLHEIGEKSRVSIVLTNPPFGGEEERGIQDNFPKDRRTSETALLFLQFIMKKLMKSYAGRRGGRCAMVVPNGTLFGDGVAARIKEDLLLSFNLHTIVRLPEGVFSPYTDIQTNLLFFEHGGPTKTIWYYEVPLPPERKGKKYTKTMPMQSREFGPIVDWWESREENEFAWKIEAKDVLKYDEDGNIASVNLDIKNPNSSDELVRKEPEELLDSILTKELEIIGIIKEMQEEMKRDTDG